MILLKLAFIFFCGSLFGWVFELFFRRFVSQKHWVNPGFLSGPYLPIYGFGLVIMYGISEIMTNIFHSTVVNNLVIILTMGIFMTLIEYIGGIIFIKGMHIKLWDYSDRWGNIQGVICPLFSLMWTVFGALYYFLIYPYTQRSLDWLSNNLAFSFFIGLFFGFFFVDLWSTLNLGTKIRSFAKEKNVVIKFENFKYDVYNKKAELKQKMRFILPFRAISNIKGDIENYLEKEKKSKDDRQQNNDVEIAVQTIQNPQDTSSLKVSVNGTEIIDKKLDDNSLNQDEQNKE